MFNPIDLSGVKVNDFSAIPEGQYTVQIQASELKNSKNGQGAYINTEMTIISDECNGRKLWAMYNVAHSNPQVVTIALQQIKQIIISSGSNIITLSSPQDLVGLVFDVYVVVEEGEHTDRNVIKKYGKTGAPLKYKARTTSKPAPTTTNEASGDIPF